MLGLIPRDHWEHNLNDFIGAMTADNRLLDRIGPLHIPGIGDCIPTRSGRAGLVAAIKALNLPSGARIGVPLYCCPVVFEAIRIADCTPLFIDIDPNTFCISPEDLGKKKAKIDAVIAVHMFGNLCDMTGLKTEAQGKPIIEDCAQALGSRIENRLAGSFGDISFFSFRAGKYLSAGEGGALFTSDAEVFSRVSQIIGGMPAPLTWDERMHVVTVYLKSILRSKPFYGMVGYPLWGFRNKKMDKTNTPDGIELSQIYRADLFTIRKRIAFIDSLIERQRFNADFYLSSLNLDPEMLCFEKGGFFYNRYHFPVTFPSIDCRDLIADYLLSRQVDTMKYLDNVVNVATRKYGYMGDCPVAECLSHKVLIIPSYYSTKINDIQHIARCLNEGWSKISVMAPGYIK